MVVAFSIPTKCRPKTRRIESFAAPLLLFVLHITTGSTGSYLVLFCSQLWWRRMIMNDCEHSVNNTVTTAPLWLPQLNPNMYYKQELDFDKISYTWLASFPFYQERSWDLNGIFINFVWSLKHPKRDSGVYSMLSAVHIFSNKCWRVYLARWTCMFCRIYSVRKSQ